MKHEAWRHGAWGIEAREFCETERILDHPRAIRILCLWLPYLTYLGFYYLLICVGAYVLTAQHTESEI